MTGAQFTPGPWHHDPRDLRGERVADRIISNEGSIIVHDVHEEADARLIATAPELYEALADVLIHCLADTELEEQDDEPNEAALALYRKRRDRAQAALAKARGDA